MEKELTGDEGTAKPRASHIRLNTAQNGLIPHLIACVTNCQVTFHSAVRSQSFIWLRGGGGRGISPTNAVWIGWFSLRHVASWTVYNYFAGILIAIQSWSYLGSPSTWPVIAQDASVEFYILSILVLICMAFCECCSWKLPTLRKGFIR